MPLPPDLYDAQYFMSDRCEGYEHYLEGRLSLVRQREFELLDVSPGMHVLDAGCGRGEVLAACARVGARVAGVDYSSAAVDLTRKALASVPDADVRVGDITNLPWADGTFDRVLFADVIEHVDPDQARLALVEFRRVLRPGGMLLVHTSPNRLFRKFTWPVLRPFARVAMAKTRELLDAYLADVLTYHVNEQTPRSLPRLVRQAGFDQVRGWVDTNVLRDGTHRLTEGLTERRALGLVVRVAALRPLRLLFGNDLYASGVAP